MTTLVLHIGSPKTGSSAIQAAIKPTRLRARSSDWCVLPTNPYRKPEPAGCIAALYEPPEELPRVWSQLHRADPRRFARDVARYRALLHRRLQPRWGTRPDALFLSSEYLWTFRVELIEQLRRDWIDLGIDRFQVIAYVRSPSAFFRSALQQHARLSTSFRRFRPHRWRYRIRQRLEAWQQVFGDALVVRPFDRTQLHQGCVVRDLQQTVQRALPDHSPLPAAPVQAAVNESVSAEELLAMQEWMLRFPAHTADGSLRRSKALWRQWQRLKRCRGDGRGTAVILDPAVEHMIQSRHQADLDWLASSFAVHLEGSDSVHSEPAELPPLDRWPEPIALEDLLDLRLDEPWLHTLRAELARRSLPRE
jgi:hypothetical protein